MEPPDRHKDDRKMRKIKKLTLGLALSLGLGSGAIVAHAQQGDSHWVSDDLSTFVRSGPTDGYRIVGTLNAGEPVTVLETSGDYTQIRAESGDVVWIQSDKLQTEPSLDERFPELKNKVGALSNELSDINESWEARVAAMTETLSVRQARIAELEQRNAQLDSQFTQTQQAVRELQARLSTQEQDLLMRYFMYGGGVAGAGLVIGLLVPHLPKRRKRDRWF
ncbi:SH3 domain protein [Modicisalibacter muralis]|uniref:SH3 domain protein n=2 Tax=Modicisalibacter muralis TaxID=119000 RepID=A0A1G9RC48_9GAMM|nr:SH3 domain protein [Halomonas muralis]